MNPVSARLLSQQLCSPQFNDPVEVVSWFGAIQAQDPRCMRLAAIMRTKRPSCKAFEKAFNDGRIVRAHLLRCTWQLVSSEDYHWIRELIHDKGISAMNGWTSSLGFKFSQAEKERSLSIINDLLSQQGIAVEEDINQALLEGGIPKEHLVYSHHLRMAELEGLVCSGPLGPKSTYMLVRDRLPEAEKLEREEALARLARKYFRSHGPASLEDFVWWSGLNVSDCRKGIAALGDELILEKWKGIHFYIHKDSRSRGFCSGSVLLLPAYDEYLIGYKSRDVVLKEEHRHHAHDNKGIFHHVVALDGEIVGNWHPSKKDGGISIFKEGVTLPEEATIKSLERFHAASKR